MVRWQQNYQYMIQQEKDNHVLYVLHWALVEGAVISPQIMNMVHFITGYPGDEKQDRYHEIRGFVLSTHNIHFNDYDIINCTKTGRASE